MRLCRHGRNPSVAAPRHSPAGAPANSNRAAALSAHPDSELTELGVTGGRTVAHVTSDDRTITTLLAGWLRNTVTSSMAHSPRGSFHFQARTPHRHRYPRFTAMTLKAMESRAETFRWHGSAY